MSVSNWEVEINSRLDQIAVDCDGWDGVLDMLAEVETYDDTFYDYLGLLVTRVKQMRRSFNRVIFYAKGTRHYKVWNYNYKMYRYFHKHYPEQFIETPFYIAVPYEVLTEKDRQRFQEKVEPW